MKFSWTMQSVLLPCCLIVLASSILLALGVMLAAMPNVIVRAAVTGPHVPLHSWRIEEFPDGSRLAPGSPLRCLSRCSRFSCFRRPPTDLATLFRRLCLLSLCPWRWKRILGKQPDPKRLRASSAQGASRPTSPVRHRHCSTGGYLASSSDTIARSRSWQRPGSACHSGARRSREPGTHYASRDVSTQPRNGFRISASLRPE